jgi:hypothetical protein
MAGWSQLISAQAEWGGELMSFTPLPWACLAVPADVSAPRLVIAGTTKTRCGQRAS